MLLLVVSTVIISCGPKTTNVSLYEVASDGGFAIIIQTPPDGFKAAGQGFDNPTHISYTYSCAGTPTVISVLVNGDTDQGALSSGVTYGLILNGVTAPIAVSCPGLVSDLNITFSIGNENYAGFINLPIPSN